MYSMLQQHVSVVSPTVRHCAGVERLCGLLGIAFPVVFCVQKTGIFPPTTWHECEGKVLLYSRQNASHVSVLFDLTAPAACRPGTSL